MNEDLIEALKPRLEEMHLLVQVIEYPNGRVSKMQPAIKGTLGIARGAVTRSVHYSKDTANQHSAIYSWDLDEDRWILVDYVAQGTPSSEFPWKKQKKR